MADVPGKFYRATKVRTGVAPSSAGSIEGEVLPPVNPPGSSLNSVGLTMPSAFTVSNSPLTANGTIGVTGAGTVAQYIRGDGSLADFPESSGGGSSVSYYLNGSVDQGTIGGIAYKELSKVPILGSGTDFTINADGYIASFITDAGDPSLLEIPGGNWNFETYFSASSSGGTPTFYVELYKVSSVGTATLLASSSSAPELIAFGTNLTPYFSSLAVPTTTLALTDRLAVRYYVTHSGRTITLHTENNHLCQIVTTFTTGLTALNGLTAQVQNFAVGTTGTDFNIASATATHTFNLPTASATNRGALSSANWTTFNNKLDLTSLLTGYTVGPNTPIAATDSLLTAFGELQGQINARVSGTLATGQVAFGTAANTVGGSSNLIFDSTNINLGIGVATAASIDPTITSVVIRDAGSKVLDSKTGVLAFQTSDASFTGTYADAVTAEIYSISENSAGSAFGIGFLTSTITGTNRGERWRITSTGILQSNGAQTIQTSTGNLTLTSADNTGIVDIRRNNRALGAELRLTNTFNGIGWISGDVVGTLNFTATDESLTEPIRARIQAVSSTVGNRPANMNLAFTTANNDTLTEGFRLTHLGNLHIGTFTADAGFRLDVNGTARVTSTMRIGTINNGVGDFITTDANGVLTRRTAAQTLTDIGAQAALTLTTTGSTGAATLVGATLNIPNYGSALSGYLPLIGGTMTGDINWAQTDRGLTWLFNTDGASIKFYNTGDGDTDSRLEFATLDNNNEYFRWVHVPSGGTTYESMRLVPNSSGNAQLIVSGSIIKSGGTSSQFLKADGSVDSTSYVSSVTASTPLASSGGTTPNITIQQASGSQSGFLSSTDFTTFNNKQNALTNPVTGTGTSGQVAYFNGTTSITSESNLFWDSTNDRLGINNATPGKSLDIVTNVSQDGIRITGSSNPRLTIIDSTNNVQFDVLTTDTEAVIRTDTNHPLHFTTNGVPRMYLNTSGNLGLGVTPSAWANGFTALQVRNASIWSTGNDASFTANAYYDGSNYRYIGSAAATRVYHNTDGSIGWSQSPSGTAGNAISFTQAMTLFSTGNLLVGTPSPISDNGARLQVSGDVRISGVSEYLRSVQTSTSAQFQSWFASDGTTRRAILGFRSGGSDNFTLLNERNGSMFIGTNDATNLTISSTGAATFSSSVQAGGEITTGSVSRAFLRQTAGGDAELGCKTGGSTTIFSNGTASLTIAASGAATFSSSVTAGGGLASGNALVLSNGTNARQFQLGYSIGAGYNYFQVYDGSSFQPMMINNSIYITSGGNVLIGTTSDNGARLQVSGTSTFSGTATFSSNVTTTGGFLQFPNNYGVEGRNAANTAHRTVLKLNTSNQIEIGRDTDISSIILGTASAVNALTLASTGAATFSSNVTVATDLTLNSGTLFVSAGSGQAYSGRLSTAYIYPYITTYLDSFAGAGWEGRLQFRTNSANGAMNTHLTILNSGAATFSNSVTAASYLGVSKDGSDTIGQGPFLVLAATTSSRQWIQQLSASQNLTYYHYNGSAWIQPVTFTAGGNVLIGTTTDNSNKLRVEGSGYFSSNLTVLGFSGLREVSGLYFSPNGLTVPEMGMYANSVSSIGFSTNTTNRMTILGNGRVGIGLNNPQSLLHINGALSFTEVGFDTVRRHRIESGHSDGSSPNNNLRFLVSDGAGSTAERMRINGSGNVLIGTQTTIGPAAGRIDVLYSGLIQYGMNIRSSYTDGIAISFVNSSGTQVGTIYQNGSSTAYNTSSDYRLKEDLKEFNGIDLINKIKTYDFKWKSDKSRSYGVVAHELQEVINYAVFGQKDSLTMQGVDYSKLVPILIKAIQEQQVQIDKLKN